MEGAVAKLQRDLFYIKHNNLGLDALIAWLTFKAVLLWLGTRPVPNATTAPDAQPSLKA
jgi:lipopolysaccharide/colanic/teichoic acid biosynthesis glycosyltransferase